MPKSDIGNPFTQVADQAKILALQNTNVSFAALALNMIALPLTMGLISVDIHDKSKAQDVAVPDEWLASVAGLPTISRKGLELLADAMKAKGWVSVAEAIRFVEIEQAANRHNQDGTTPSDPGSKVYSPGASMLLARAERDLPGTIQRFADGAQAFAQAAGGVISFTAEATASIGRGLGAVAEAMRTARDRRDH
ncbi:hypothetical protein [Pseudomonas sp. MWU12-2323]|uniref:hypothetical protein n=1 Tax=Pseudomonas sp. MWU12-2323 TaxID=2651296 RepID=UPI00128C38C0|nr:hypothetical protein [Pseudomonas sp. MWU12-2323]MPQ69458.1 hypothetical protein [Pseudomonas sp. MWU12-2323]